MHSASQQQQGYGPPTEVDETGGAASGIAEGEIRSGFVRKVYGILSIQLLVTFGIAFFIQQQSGTWIVQHQQYAQFAMILSLVLILGVSCCCQEVARTYPMNMVFLFAVTVCESVLVGFISAMYTTQSVVMAVILTAGIFFSLTAYAFVSKTDFTGMGGYLYAGVMGLILTSFLCMFFPSPMMQKLLAGAGAILFSFYIVYDTQLIVGGKHKKHQFGVDDYVFACLNIYLDIINLFLYLLSLFGERR